MMQLYCIQKRMHAKINYTEMRIEFYKSGGVDKQMIMFILSKKYILYESTLTGTYVTQTYHLLLVK